jgi:serine protease Do
MPWGDSDQLEVGDSVLAIGSPYGLFHTVTSGIISAKERYNALEDGPTFQEFLQTDAAVNPGSSGGPLVDMEGRLVGINTAIYGEAYQGISFSIPSRVAKTVYEQIRETGEVTHGWLGVLSAPLPEKMAREHGLEKTTGVLMVEVLPGSPAQKAGLRNYDIVMKWNDIPVHSPADLTHAALLSSPGSEVQLKVIRDGKPIDLEVVVGRRPVRL